MREADLPALLPEIVRLSRVAGHEILAVYITEFTVETKPDHSPLTAADLGAHRCLLAGLATLTPEVPIISEESAGVPYEERSRWPWYWLLDPLDGTREFVKRNGEFTVNVALIHHHQPVLGVVHVPVTDLTYFAALGRGAFKQAGADPAYRIQTRAWTNDPLVVVGSRSHDSDWAARLACIGTCHTVAVGSSLKFCLVAEGTADLYPRFGPTSEWDTAAAHCVVEQAGGRVTDLSGQTLRYNTKEDYLNPEFLAFGDPTHDWYTAFAATDQR